VRPLLISFHSVADVSSRGTSFVANEKKSPAVAIARREKVNKFLLHGKLLKSKDAVLLGDLMGWSMAGANRTLRQVFPGGGGLA
jgi:hypothetical protein